MVQGNQSVDGPSSQRDWYENPIGKIAIGVAIGLIIWLFTKLDPVQRDALPTVVIERVTEPMLEDKATKPELAKPRSPSAQRTEDRKERENPAKPDPP